MTRWQKSGEDDRISFDNHGYEFAWGGGAQFAYSHYGIRLEYERFTVVDTNGAKILSLSLIAKL